MLKTGRIRELVITADNFEVGASYIKALQEYSAFISGFWFMNAFMVIVWRSKRVVIPQGLKWVR